MSAVLNLGMNSSHIFEIGHLECSEKQIPSRSLIAILDFEGVYQKRNSIKKNKIILEASRLKI